MLQTSLRQRGCAILTSSVPVHGRAIASIAVRISAPCKQRCAIRQFSAFKRRQKVRGNGAPFMKDSFHPQSCQQYFYLHFDMQPIFSSRASLSASPALTVEVATRTPNSRPHSLLRLAVLLGVGLVAVSLLSPAAAWAKGAASTPSYSFPAAARGALQATFSVQSIQIFQDGVAVLALFLISCNRNDAPAVTPCHCIAPVIGRAITQILS